MSPVTDPAGSPSGRPALSGASAPAPLRPRPRSRAPCAPRSRRSTGRSWRRCIRRPAITPATAVSPDTCRAPRSASGGCWPATPARPALGIEGDTIRLRLGSAAAAATAVGPDVPARIQGTSVPVTPARFLITFAGVQGAVAIAPRYFTIIDEEGHLHHPRLTALGGGRPAATVPAGRPYTIVPSLRLPVGNGAVRYPPAGGHYLAAWDFDVETD